MPMIWELCDIILSAGKNAAMRKMSLEKNISKPDMRLSSFKDLHLLLQDEVRELRSEIFRSVSGKYPPIEVLKAIRDEAGDIIAFASGIAAKADLEIIRLNPQPSLWDEWDMPKIPAKEAGSGGDSD
jgi:hypothetical protein